MNNDIQKIDLSEEGKAKALKIVQGIRARIKEKEEATNKLFKLCLRHLKETKQLDKERADLIDALEIIIKERESDGIS